jgi:hypothetical protein
MSDPLPFCSACTQLPPAGDPAFWVEVAFEATLNVETLLLYVPEKDADMALRLPLFSRQLEYVATLEQLYKLTSFTQESASERLVTVAPPPPK